MSIANNIKSLTSSFTSSFKSGSDTNLAEALNNANSSYKSMPSILSKDIEIEGEINSGGVLEIQGKVKGVIRGNSVVIREDGVVEGRLEVDSVSIRGKFSGDMKARSISIFKKAKIVGNIEYISLSVEDGAYIEGQFKQLSDNRKVVKKSEV